MKAYRNIPIPAGKWSKYPWREMGIGESIFFRSKELRVRKQIEGASRMFGKRTGRKFTTRQVKGGIRCWRVG